MLSNISSTVSSVVTQTSSADFSSASASAVINPGLLSLYVTIGGGAMATALLGCYCYGNIKKCCGAISSCCSIFFGRHAGPQESLISTNCEPKDLEAGKAQVIKVKGPLEGVSTTFCCCY